MFDKGRIRKPLSFISEQAGVYEYVPKHLRGDTARRGVLLARMVARQQHRSSRMCVVRPTVAEAEGRPGLDETLVLQDREIGIESDRSQRHNHAYFFQKLKFLREVPAAAGQNLISGRLVIRRNAAHGGTDVGTRENETVLACNAFRLTGETGFVQCTIQKLAGAITGEHSTGSIRAVCARSEADQKNARVRVPKARNWAAPIVLSRIGPAADPSDLLPMRNQARTAAALDQIAIEYIQSLQRVRNSADAFIWLRRVDRTIRTRFLKNH